MTVESIDKLREYGHDCCARIDDAIHGYADAIEAEISERYMPLPLDADGVPIRIGDTVREFDDRVPMKVASLTFYEDCVDVNTCGMNPNLLYHVKPRTIEDVLGDLIELCHNTFGSSCMFERDKQEIIESGNFKAFVDEIRGMK